MVSPTSEVLMVKAKTKLRSRPKPTTIPKRKSRPNAVRASGAGKGKTKQDRVLSMLRTGVTVAAIARATGWQSHSVRGFLAGIVRRKLGLGLASAKTDTGRVYRIVEAKSQVLPRKAASRGEQPHG